MHNHPQQLATNHLAAQTIVTALEAHKLQDVLISPGSSHTPLVLACANSPKLTKHVVLDERSAAFLALGLSRASGLASVLVATCGSAPAHYLPAVIEAHHSEIPLLLLTADRPSYLQHCGNLQTTSQLSLFSAYIRASFHLKEPEPNPNFYEYLEWLQNVVGQAIFKAQKVYPGPVHLNIAFNEPFWAPSLETAAPIYPAAPLPSFQIQDAILETTPHLRREEPLTKHLLKHCQETTRGAFVLGPQKAAPETTAFLKQLYKLAQTLQWPILSEVTSQANFGPHLAKSNPTDSVVIPKAAYLLRDPNFRATQRADFVIQCGWAPTAKVFNQWLTATPRENHILLNEHGLTQDPQKHAASLLALKPLALVTALNAALRELPLERTTAPSAWLQSWQQAAEAADAELQLLLKQHAAHLWEGSLYQHLFQALPPKVNIHLANSLPLRDLDLYLLNDQKIRQKEIQIFTNRGVSGIDGTLATAYGEALNSRPTPLVVILGDLSFFHDLGSLQAIQHLQPIPLTYVVLNNGGGGIFNYLPIAKHPQHFQEYFCLPQKTSLAALSAAYQIPYTCLDDSHLPDLTSILTAKLTTKDPALPAKPQIIEIRIHQPTSYACHLAPFNALIPKPS